MSRGREGAQVEMPHVEKGLGATVGPQLLLAVRQNPGSERLGQELPAPWAAPRGCWWRGSLRAQEGAGALRPHGLNRW